MKWGPIKDEDNSSSEMAILQEMDTRLCKFHKFIIKLSGFRFTGGTTHHPSYHRIQYVPMSASSNFIKVSEWNVLSFKESD